MNDNRHLYIDPGSNQRLRGGTLSPPMVVFNDPFQAVFPKAYLFQNLAHPVASWQPGYSAPQAVPHLGGMDWYGIRVNMELFEPDNPGWLLLGSPVNNVQTFLIVQGQVAGPLGGESQGALALSPSSRERAREASSDTMREIAARRRR